VCVCVCVCVLVCVDVCLPVLALAPYLRVVQTHSPRMLAGAHPVGCDIYIYIYMNMMYIYMYMNMW